MIEMTVEDVPTGSGRAVAPGTSAAVAAQSLRDPAVSALVVVDDEDAVIGIVTESDFVALVAEGSDDCTVGTIMSSPVVTVSPTASLTAAAKRMREAGVRRLPVVDGDVYRGLVSWTTLLPYLSPHRLEIEWRSEPLSLEGSNERHDPDDESPVTETRSGP